MKKIVKIIGVITFILFEEILWNKIGLPIYNRIVDLRVTERFKHYVVSIRNEYFLLGIFLLPVLIEFLLGILLTKALLSGMIFSVIGIYVLKGLITICMVIIFNTGKKILVQFFVIRYSYGTILRLKRTETYRFVKNYLVEVKAELRVFKENFVHGDGKFIEELVEIYKRIKKI